MTVGELVSYGRYPHQRGFGRLTKQDMEVIDWALEVTGTQGTNIARWMLYPGTKTAGVDCDGTCSGDRNDLPRRTDNVSGHGASA